MSKSKKRDFKAMFAEHVEKGVFGITVIAMLYFLMSSFKPGIDPNLRPENLDQLAGQAEVHMTTADKLPPTKYAEKKFQERAIDINTTVAYRPQSSWDDVIFSKIDRRKMPQLFAPEEIHVVTLVGAISFNDKQAAVIVKGKYAKNQQEKEEAKREKEELLRQKAERDKAKKGGGGKEGGGDFRPQVPVGPRPGKQPGKQPATSITPQKIEEPEPVHPYENSMLPEVRAEVFNIGVITTLIPYKKLVESYRCALIEGKTPLLEAGSTEARTLPVITGMLVERAEVTGPDQPLDKLKWNNLSQGVETWASSKDVFGMFDPEPEIFPAVFNAGSTLSFKGLTKSEKSVRITYPLPKLANRPWGRLGVHPRIPSELDINKLEAEQNKQEIRDNFAPEEQQVNPFGGAQNVSQQTLLEKPEEILEYKMLRFIDPFQAQGAKYRYRVTLTYLNPNYNVPLQNVEDPQMASVKEIIGPTSEPSAVVTPPIDRKLVVWEVSANQRPPADSTKVERFWYWMIGKIEPNNKDRTGAEVAKEFTNINLGDMFENIDKIPAIYNHMLGQIEEIEKYHFTSNQSYLVDLHGSGKIDEKESVRPGERPPVGDKLAAAPKPPEKFIGDSFEMLYADANGVLHVSNSLRDYVTIENTKKRYERAGAPGNSPFPSGPIGPRRGKLDDID